MNSALVSVVIPTWNRAALLGDALDSVFAQNYAPVQVIVVDDGSTDDTRSLAARYPGVEYYRQEHAGSAAARNRGVAHARGDYIAFLDSDDVWLPGKLRTELDLFRQFPAAGAIISDSEHWLQDRQTRASRFAATLPGFPTGEPWFLPRDTTLWVDVSLFSTCCLILKRPVLDAVAQPVFTTAMEANEDWDFEIRMYQVCEVLVCPRILARVRRYPDHTRGNRAIPGTIATVEQLRAGAVRHKRIMERARTLQGLTPDQTRKIEEKLEELELKIADFDLRIRGAA